MDNLLTDNFGYITTAFEVYHDLRLINNVVGNLESEGITNYQATTDHQYGPAFAQNFRAISLAETILTKGMNLTFVQSDRLIILLTPLWKPDTPSEKKHADILQLIFNAV